MPEVGRILFVEDDPKDVELTMAVLGENRLANEVVLARDGAEAIDYLKRVGRFRDRPVGNPAVILLDLKLPRLNGQQVLAHIRADDALKTIPVVVLTSSHQMTDLEECYRLGANAYVVKPVAFADFENAIKTLGLFWAVVNETPPAPPRTS